MPPPDDDFEKAWAGGGDDDFDSAWNAAPTQAAVATPPVDDRPLDDADRDALLARVGWRPDNVEIRRKYGTRREAEKHAGAERQAAFSKTFGAVGTKDDVRRLSDALDEEEAFAYFREPIGGDQSGVKDNPFRGKPDDARAFVADRTRARAAARLPLGLEAIRRASAALTLGGTEAIIPKANRALMAEAEAANPRTGLEKAALFGATAAGAAPPWTLISRGLGLATGARTAAEVSRLVPAGGAVQAGVQTAVEGGGPGEVFDASVIGGATAGAFELIPVGLRALKAKRAEAGVGKMRLEPEAPASPASAPAAAAVPDHAPVAAASPEVRAPAPEPVGAPVAAVEPPVATVEPPAATVAPEGVGKMRLEPEAADPVAPDAPPVGTKAGEPTSIKNATVNAERAARGVGEMPQPERRGMDTVEAEARSITEADPTRPETLAREVAAKPRPLTAVEDALLARRRVDLHKAREKADADVIAASDAGNADAVAEAMTRRAQVNEAFLEAEVASKAGGTESARGLGARAWMMQRDYSLLGMETRRRVEANQGKPLTPKQAAETKALHEQLAKAIAERDAYAARLAERPASPGSRQKPPATKSAEYGASNRLVTRDAYNATLASIRSKLGGTRLSANIDPTIIADLAKVGAFHLEAGSRTFAAWSRAMVDDLGDKVKPHLKAAWAEARKNLPDDIRAKVDTPAATVEPVAAQTKAGAAPISDKQAIALEAKVGVAKKAWDEVLVRDKLKNRSAIEKAVTGALVEAPNAARALMTSFDLSAVLRQGGFIALGHPIRAARAMGTMFKSLVSKKAHAMADAELTLRPNHALAKRSGLFLSDQTSQTLSQMEEAYMSRWVRKIPGVAASQRAYTSFLNRLRMDSFDTMVATLSRNGAPTEAEAKAIANYVNVATGRGSLGGFEKAATGLGTVFFSPRYVTSRFQLLAGQPMYGGSAATRRMVAGEYARFLGGLGAVYSLGALAGGEVEFDPRSSDFGKIRFGTTRLDPLTGLSQSSVLVSRLATGETKSVRTGAVTPIRGDVRYGARDALDVMVDFGRSKLSPAAGAAVDVAVGKNILDQEVTPKSVALGLATPISFRSIYETMQSQGIPKGSALALLSLFGIGLQDFDAKKR